MKFESKDKHCVEQEAASYDSECNPPAGKKSSTNDKRYIQSNKRAHTPTGQPDDGGNKDSVSKELNIGKEDSCLFPGDP